VTRKHFELIAETLRGAVETNADSRDALPTLAAHFADALRRTNPNFNRARFLAACGVEGY
jgi:hypothetical protein